MFGSYEAELEEIVQAVRRCLVEVEELDGNPRERRRLLQKCEVDLNQAESLVRQMNVEARSDPSSGNKRKMGPHKETLKKLRQDFSAVQQKSERQDLFESRNTERTTLSREAREDRNRFEQVTARLDSSTESLLQSRQALAETEEVALSITENLASNRSQIIGVHERVTATGGLIGTAGQILRRMRDQERRKKLMLYGLIFFLVFVIILIFYFALRPSSTTTSNDTDIPPNHVVDNK